MASRRTNIPDFTSLHPGYTNKFEKWQGSTKARAVYLAPSPWYLAPVLKGGDPPQLHPGTRSHCYRCSLPGLAGFTAVRREGTGTGHHGARIILVPPDLSYVTAHD